MVLPTGFEPVTLGFRDRSSAAELKAAFKILEFSANENSEASRPNTEHASALHNEREARRQELALVMRYESDFIRSMMRLPILSRCFHLILKPVDSIPPNIRALL